MKCLVFLQFPNIAIFPEILTDKDKAILAIPQWHSLYWFQALLEMLIYHPHCCTLAACTPKGIRIAFLVADYFLITFLISGNPCIQQETEAQWSFYNLALSSHLLASHMIFQVVLALMRERAHQDINHSVVCIQSKSVPQSIWINYCLCLKTRYFFYQGHWRMLTGAFMCLLCWTI